jgi:peptidoglycan/xylan/chitin deacetylase (PgdA/CDA1 family)
MLPVLAYHYFESKGTRCSSIKREDRVYVVQEEMFRQQMDHLRSKGYAISDLEKESSNYGIRRCIISIDDGQISCYTIGFPILMNQGIRCLFFICPGKMNQEGNMTWSQLREIVEGGMFVGSHSYSHAPLDRMDENRLRFELTASKKEIEDRMGIRVSSIALPMGFYNKRCLDLIQTSGYTHVFTSRKGYNLRVRNHIYERIMVKSHHTLQDFRKMLEFNLATSLKHKIINSARAVAMKAMPMSVYSSLRRGILLRIGY